MEVIYILAFAAHSFLMYLIGYRLGFNSALDTCGVIRGSDAKKLTDAMRENEANRRENRQ